MPKIRELVILDDPTLTYLRGRSKFQFYMPLRLAWNYGPWHRQLTVPIGSHTNGASIPRLLQGLLPVLDDTLVAGAVHDYLASTPGTGVGRAEADALAREIKRRGNVPGWRAWTIWLGTRAVGWIKWHGAVESVNVPPEPAVRLDPARGGPGYEGG